MCYFLPRGGHTFAQKYRDRNGRCIAIVFKSIGVRGRFGSPEKVVFRGLFKIASGNIKVTSRLTTVRNPFAPYRGHTPQNREKRASDSTKKKYISHHPRKGRSESKKTPHFYAGHYRGNGDFWTQNTLFWGGGKRGFLNPKTLFSRFWGV